MDWRLKVLVAAIIMLAAFAVGYSRLSVLPTSHAGQGPHSSTASNEGTEKDRPVERKGLLERTAEDPVALFTALLTIFTGLLFLATCGLWYMAVRQSSDSREGVAAARIAAEAAKRSADVAEAALVGAEPPYLYPLLASFRPEEVGDYPGPEFVESIAIVRFGNYGNSPAIVQAVDITVAPHQVFPPVKPIEFKNFYQIMAIIPPNHVEVLLRSGVGKGLDKIEIDGVKPESGWPIYVNGYVRYADMAGQQYITHINYFYNVDRHTFMAVGGQTKNHRRKLTAEEMAQTTFRDY